MATREKSPWEIEAEARLRAKILAEVPDSKGVRRWSSNGKVIPHWTFEDAGMECPPAQKVAHEEESAEFIRRYCEQQAKRGGPSDEERYEARAAFGPGVELVDVFSGRRWTT
jgi:hypothetical protein